MVCLGGSGDPKLHPKSVTQSFSLFPLCLSYFPMHFAFLYSLWVHLIDSEVRNASDQKASFNIQLEMLSLMLCSEGVTDCEFTDYKAKWSHTWKSKLFWDLKLKRIHNFFNVPINLMLSKIKFWWHRYVLNSRWC